MKSLTPLFAIIFFVQFAAIFFLDVLSTIIVMAVVGFVFLAYIILLDWKTPSTLFLWSWMKKKDLLQVFKANKTEFIPAENKSGMISEDDMGDFIEGNGYTDGKSGVTIYPVDPMIGITMDHNILQGMKALQRLGIKDFEEAETINNFWYKCNTDKCGFEGIPTIDNNEVKECPKCHKKENLVKTEMTLNIPLYKQLSFSGLADYFKYNMNPHVATATIERKVKSALQSVGNPKDIIKWIFPIVILLIGGAIAYTILVNQQNVQTNMECCQQLANYAIQKANATISNPNILR